MACKVSVVDEHGIIHEVEVDANSAYEALAKAMRHFRDHPWSLESQIQSETANILVKQPEVVLKVNIPEFNRFMSRTGGSPADVVRRANLKAILEL
jgi:hypothetical protein